MIVYTDFPDCLLQLGRLVIPSESVGHLALDSNRCLRCDRGNLFFHGLCSKVGLKATTECHDFPKIPSHRDRKESSKLISRTTLFPQLRLILRYSTKFSLC